MCRGLTTSIIIASLLAGCGKDEAQVPATEPGTPPVVAESAEPAEPALDPVTGLRMAADWEIVRANCTACHSAKLVTQQRGTAEQWLTMIRWMQKKQNLWQFDPATEEKIVAYLAANYPPSAARRRAALSPDLMPPNPYAR